MSFIYASRLHQASFRKALGLLAILVYATGGFGATYHVATNGSDAVGKTGADWGNAFLTITKAISTAQDGDQILVSNGTYNIAGRILVHKGLTIRSWNNGALDPSGTIIQRPSGAANYRIFELNHADAMLQGLTITNGNAPSGGGVWIDKGATLEDCIISGNVAEGHGGGVIGLRGGTCETVCLSETYPAAMEVGCICL